MTLVLRTKPGRRTTKLIGASAPASAELIIGLTTSNSITTFDSASPGTITAPIPVTGLVANDVLQDIDIRPFNAQLYAAGSSGTIYIIDPATGIATAQAALTADAAVVRCE